MGYYCAGCQDEGLETETELVSCATGGVRWKRVLLVTLTFFLFLFQAPSRLRF